MNAPKNTDDNKRVGSIVASPYIKKAKRILRLYLRYDEADDITKFEDIVQSIADYLQKEEEYTLKVLEQSNENSNQSLENIKSESYSEGPVTVSKTYENSTLQSKISSIQTAYKSLIDNELNSIKDYRKVLVVKRTQKCY